MTKDYDSYDGIRNATKSLKAFHDLIKARHEAGYKRKEQMEEWYLFNMAISLDTCGNMGRGKGNDSLNIPIITKGAFFNFYEKFSEKGQDDLYMSHGFGGTSNMLPREGKHCPICGEEWTMQNFLDSYSTNTRGTLNPVKGGYLNKTREQVADLFTDKYTYVWVTIWDDKGHVVSDPDYKITGDEMGEINNIQFYHPECLRLKKTIDQQIKFEEVLKKAGFKFTLFTPIKNEYWTYPEYSKWFLVDTECGQIKIGWRKHVINIECESVDMKELTTDTVTNDSHCVHAWNYEDAEIYLRTLRERMCK